MSKASQPDLFETAVTTEVPTLEKVIERLHDSALSATRQRDLISAVRRFCKLTDQREETTPAVLADIRTSLERLGPGTQMSAKTWSNFRSNLLAALDAAQVRVLKTARVRLSSEWQALLATISDRRTREGLSRFMRYCSLNGRGPSQVDQAVFSAFQDAIRSSTIVRDADMLERDVVTLWNRLAARSSTFALRTLNLPSRRRPNGRVSLEDMPASFRADVEQHLAWAACTDVFAFEARNRHLAPSTIKLRRDQMLTAATALIASGVEAASITSLAELTAPAAIQAVMRQRGAATRGDCKVFDRDLAKALVAISWEWVKPAPEVVSAHKRILARIGQSDTGLTVKNKALLRELSDEHLLRRLINLPSELWRRVERKPLSLRSLADAQAALAIAILLVVPLRVANLTSLAFDQNLFLPSNGVGETQLEISAKQMKNREPYSAALPPSMTTMLIVHRDKMLKPLLGRKPVFLFDDGFGRPKRKETMSSLVERTIQRHLGFRMTAHQFRHLAAKLVLDDNPGAYELARQLLGHLNLVTTTRSYTGLNTARAARKHAELIEAKRAHSAPDQAASKSSRRGARI